MEEILNKLLNELETNGCVSITKEIISECPDKTNVIMELCNKVKEKYGDTKTVECITEGTMAPKVYLNDVTYFVKLTQTELDILRELTKFIEEPDKQTKIKQTLCKVVDMAEFKTIFANNYSPYNNLYGKTY